MLTSAGKRGLQFMLINEDRAKVLFGNEWQDMTLWSIVNWVMTDKDCYKVVDCMLEKRRIPDVLWDSLTARDKSPKVLTLFAMFATHGYFVSSARCTNAIEGEDGLYLSDCNTATRYRTDHRHFSSGRSSDMLSYILNYFEEISLGTSHFTFAFFSHIHEDDEWAELCDMLRHDEQDKIILMNRFTDECVFQVLDAYGVKSAMNLMEVAYVFYLDTNLFPVSHHCKSYESLAEEIASYLIQKSSGPECTACIGELFAYCIMIGNASVITWGDKSTKTAHRYPVIIK